MNSKRMMIIAAGLGLAAPARGASAAQEQAHDGGFNERTAAAVRLRTISLTTGVALEVAESGPETGEPVLFLHGYTDSWYSFLPLVERLPAGLRAIIPSQRGHGDSDRPECCYRTGDFASDAVALLDALGISRASVVGHSMGSFVAQRIAIDHPERLSRLVLVGSGATYRTPLMWELWNVVRTLEDPVPTEFVRDFQVGTATRPLPAAFLATVIAESGKLPARVWRDALEHVLESDAADELERIVAPTLVFRGELDEIFPREVHDQLVHRLRNARDIVYEGTGHAIHWENPDRFVVDLEAFLAPKTSVPSSNPRS